MRLILLSNINTYNPIIREFLQTINFDYCVSLGNVHVDYIKYIAQQANGQYSYLLGSNDKPKELIEYDTLHLKTIQILNYNCVGIQYAERYKYWNDGGKNEFENIDFNNIDILLSYNSPYLFGEKDECVDEPDYAYYLMEQIGPKIHIYGSSGQNTVGTLSGFKYRPVRTIGINGIVIIELDDELQIREFVVLQ